MTSTPSETETADKEDGKWNIFKAESSQWRVLNFSFKDTQPFSSMEQSYACLTSRAVVIIEKMCIDDQPSPPKRPCIDTVNVEEINDDPSIGEYNIHEIRIFYKDGSVN